MKGVHLYGCNERKYDFKSGTGIESAGGCSFQSLGMDLSTATGIFYRQALRYHGLPFEVKLDEPNEVTYEAMAAAENDEEMYGPFDSVAEMMEALNA